MFSLYVIKTRLESQLATSLFPDAVVQIAATREPDMPRTDKPYLRIFYGDSRGLRMEELTSAASGFTSSPEFRILALEIRLQTSIEDFPALFNIVDLAIRKWHPFPDLDITSEYDAGFLFELGQPLAIQNRVLTYMLTYNLVSYF